MSGFQTIKQRREFETYLSHADEEPERSFPAMRGILWALVFVAPLYLIAYLVCIWWFR